MPTPAKKGLMQFIPWENLSDAQVIQFGMKSPVPSESETLQISIAGFCFFYMVTIL